MAARNCAVFVHTMTSTHSISHRHLRLIFHSICWQRSARWYLLPHVRASFRASSRHDAAERERACGNAHAGLGSHAARAPHGWPIHAVRRWRVSAPASLLPLLLLKAHAILAGEAAASLSHFSEQVSKDRVLLVFVQRLWAWPCSARVLGAYVRGMLASGTCLSVPVQQCVRLCVAG